MEELSNEAKENLIRLLGAQAQTWLDNFATIEDELIIEEINNTLTSGVFADEEYDVNYLATNPNIKLTIDTILSETVTQWGTLDSSLEEDITPEEIEAFKIEAATQSESFRNVLSLTNPKFGEFETSKSRFYDEPTSLQDVEGGLDPLQSILADDEWFIKEEITQILGVLEDDQKALIAIELAYLGIGDYDGIYRDDGTFDSDNFTEQIGEALMKAEANKPTFSIYEDDAVHIAGQAGLDQPETFQALTGQSGRTVEEIEALYELGIADSGSDSGYRYYDPVYLMDVVNQKASTMLGVNLTASQKDAFIELMKEVVDTHSAAGNLQMPVPDVHAKKFVEETLPELTLGKAQADTIRGIEAAVRMM